jgi:Carboxypeptidase regulatory-like domain/Fibronectin type III domain/Domain of unknown function (DUF4214)
MKGSPAIIQPRRFGFRLTAIIVVLITMAFLTATALMQDNNEQQEREREASGPAQRASARLEESLFVDEDEDAPRQARPDQEPLPAAPEGDIPAYSLPKVTPAVFNGDVRSLPYIPQNMREFREPEEPSNNRPFMPEALKEHQVQPNVPLAPMPGPVQNFPGLTRTDLCTGGQCGAGIPPDTNGDVGPNHYIQTVNTAVGIYNKTGTLLASFTFNSLWSGAGTGTPCDANHGGDPVVLYDSMADRWILSDLGFGFNGAGQPVAPFYECIAVSKTSDPVAGGWFLYPIRTDTGSTGQPPVGTLNDYPKFGLWTDCLYYTANGFGNAASFNGVEFGSFSRTDMYSGAALTGAIGFIAGGTNFALLPANLSAPAAGLPPPGTLEYFVAESATAFSWDVRKFTPGTHCGGGGSMGAAVNVTQPTYSVPGTNIVPQPNDAGATHNLDSLGDRLMQKAQYRNVGGTESIWVVHTTRSSASSNTQPGWAQLNVTGGTVAAAPAQQQNYAPDLTLFRWMGNIAADKDGNVAMGYSTSNATSPNFPSIAYSGRLAGDTLNQLPQSETVLVSGAGSELNTCGGAACHRWGDYSSMSVDPSDSCTFWITSEYYVDQTSGNAGSWNTRIGSFVFPTCTAAVSSPTVPSAPTGLSFTNVAATSMTVNWTDTASNEDGFVIYRSTDNVHFTFAAETAANTNSGNVTGLNPSTTYFFHVHAFTKGALSTAATGTQATPAPTVVTSVPAGGLWSQTATWSSGIVPTNADNVTIVDGATVTIDTAAVALNVTVGTGGAAANLVWDATAAQSLTIGQNLTIAANGSFTGPATGTVTTHSLSVAGDLTNNGVLDFSTNTNTAGAGITFTGSANNTFGGSGPTTNIRTLTINKGTTFAPTLELNPTNFTVQGTTTDGAPMAFLTLTNGTLKISGTFTMTGRVFSVAGYSIIGSAGFWLNNPNFTVAAQNGTGTITGFFRLSQGTFNLGTGAGSALAFNGGATIIVEGGALNSSGRVAVAAAGNAIQYTQTAGTITVCTVGNTSTTLGSFDMGTSLSSTVNISGGTIIVQLASTAATGPRDYRMQSSVGSTGVTGGTLQLGNAATPAAIQAFSMRGVLPNLVITNTTANHTAQMDSTLVNYNNLSRNVTINTGNTFNLNNVTFLMGGTTLTNNGTLTGNGANSVLYWFGILPNAAQTYTGSGVVTAPLSSMSFDNALGVTLSGVNQIPTLRVNLFTGNVTNANKITLGNAAATTGTVQVGNTTTPTNAGSFDVAPVFNLGTGGQILSYLRTTLSRTTGFEVNPTRTLTSLTYDDNDITHSLTIAGGDLIVNGGTGTGVGAITLTNGRIVTGANTLYFNPNAPGTATVVRTNGSIDGNFKKSFAAASSKTFEVGTANGFSPVTINATAGTFPADFTVKATQGPQPSVNAATSVQRYWTLTNSTLTSADLTFAYLVGDVQGTEANYKVIRIASGIPVSFPTSTVNTGAHTATLLGATGFSDWTVGEVSSPTAANGAIAGRVTDTGGAPVAGATLRLSGTETRTTTSGSSGNYSFAEVETGGFYSVTPSLANYHFSPANRSFSLVADKTDAVFTAAPDAVPTANAIDTNEYFVRQQYLDFLGREPESGGFNFWMDQLNQCNSDAACTRTKRIDVSAAFFDSQEFRDTGSFVYGLYAGTLGRTPTFAEFGPDRSQVVGGANVEQARAAFADSFINRAEFTAKYPQTLSREQFVDALLQTMQSRAGIAVSRDALLSAYDSGGRVATVRAGIEAASFVQAENNKSFVLMEYFGYLRRNPDPAGYDFWLNVLTNNEPGNYRGMVCSFLTSAEYQHRFGATVTHTNSECAGQ